MLNLIVLIFMILGSKEPLSRTKIKNISSSSLLNLEYSLIVDEGGFYPNKIYINSKTSLNLKIANLLNKDLSFVNSDLNIYTAIKPRSSKNIIIKIKDSGNYEFNCAINKLKMYITVD